MPHYPAHFYMGVAAFAATLLVWGLTVNQLVKRKLKLSIFLLAAYVAVHLVFLVQPDLGGGATDLTSPIRPFERLALTTAVVNLLVIALINPLRADRVRDRFPAIVQDAIVLGMLLIVATFVFKEQLLTTSAVGAVVVGFALQETLGNAFAGLAIQSERPFRVGHWIQVGQFEGRVTEFTWRATKLRTRTGNFVVVPNNIVAKEAITNYSEPAAPSRVHLEVGVSYDASPFAVKQAIQGAMVQAPRVLRTPAPDVLLVGFDASSMNYRARFWVNDHEFDEEAQDEVRVAIHYALARARNRDSVSRSRSSTRGTGPSPTPGPNRRVVSACWRASICSRRCPRPSARIWRRRPPPRPSAMEKRSSVRGTPAIRCMCCARAGCLSCWSRDVRKSRSSSRAATSARCRC